MKYKAYRDGTGAGPIAIIIDANWPRLNKGVRLPVSVDGKEGMYTVTKVGDDKMEGNEIVADIWIKAD